MSNPLRLLAAAVGTAILLQGIAGAANAPSGPKSYRWVDSKGVVHYGDSVPPEYASQSRQELNPQAVPLRETPRQPTPAEAAEAHQAATEAAKIRQHDSFLLTTYTQVGEIEQLRDERVGLIDGQMEIARLSLNGTAQRIASVESRMRNFQPYSPSPSARRLPDQLAEEAVRTLKERRSLTENLAAREAEKNALRAQFDADIARFRELTRQPGR